MRILLAQNSLYYPARGGGDKSNRLLLEALAARGHRCRAVARISVFGASEEERYLAELASRGVPPQAAPPGVVAFERDGVEVRVVTNANLRVYFADQVEAFQPDVILASTDDPAQLLLEVALRAPEARVVYLARATLAVPFGPDCAFPSVAKTERIRAADAVIGVSQYVANYIREHAGIAAVHVPISLMETSRPGALAPAGDSVATGQSVPAGPDACGQDALARPDARGPDAWPVLGRFDNEFVTIVNPCAVKGITIFLALAEAFPTTTFAAVPMWGTNAEDRAALAQHPNVRIVDAVDDIDLLLARTRVLLAPSLWAEARSRIVLEAMLRGVPVMASNVGGIPEAKLGVPYLLPVNPIARYQTRVDEQMVPVAEVPPQDVGPWREALGRLVSDRAHYEEIARASRAAALEYAASLSAEPFERILREVVSRPKKGLPEHESALPRSPELPAAKAAGSEHLPEKRSALVPEKRSTLSPDKRKLLALRLRRQAPASAWFPGAEEAAEDAAEETAGKAGGLRLFWFPHAGGGASSIRAESEKLAASGKPPRDAIHICPVRLPGRESRLAEAPFERMNPMVAALASAIEIYLAQPFAFFGHSMGAVVAFELARLLRRRQQPLPSMLIASGARAPQYRRGHVPPPAPDDPQLLAELRRLQGVPNEVLDDPAVMRVILPALRADTAVYRNYVYTEEEPLPCPIRAYGGIEDPQVQREHLEAWGRQTSASFAVRLFPGGHFYLNSGREAVLEALAHDLACQGAIARTRGGPEDAGHVGADT